MTAELLDEGPDDVEVIVVQHLWDLLPEGQVSHSRLAGDPLPFIYVNHLGGEECDEESTVDELVSIHTLYPKGLGQSGKKAAAEAAAVTHRRMLLLARYLVDVPLPSGRNADIDYCDVAMRPRWEEYGDPNILRKVGRYRIGLSYVKLS